MARTNAQSNALKPKDRITERLNAQKHKMEMQGEPKQTPPISTGEDVQTETEPDAKPKQAGRPALAVKREKAVLYLDPDNATALKMCGVTHRASYSDVANALIRNYLQQVTPAQIAAEKDSKNP